MTPHAPSQATPRAAADAALPLPPAGRAPRTALVTRIAGWSIRHRAIAVLGWIALVVAALAVGALASGGEPEPHDVGESGRAQRALTDAGVRQLPLEQVLLRRADPAGAPHAAADPRLRAASADLVTALRGLRGSVVDVTSWLDAGQQGLVSRDRRSVLVQLHLPDADTPGADPDAAIDAVEREVSRVQRAHPDLVVAQAGEASVDKAITEQVTDDLARAEKLSLPVTIVILLVVFGSVVAAGIPVLLAATAVAAAVALLAVPGRWIPLDESTASLVLLVGMAVGVDYTLFYLRREREERRLGRSGREALLVAADTSGRAVVAAGLTVMVSLCGLILTGIDIFAGMAIGTVVVVGLAVLASLTVLPATLSLLGDRVEALRLPWIGRRRRAAGRSRFWTAVVRRVVTYPLRYGFVALLGLLGLAAVGLGMTTAMPPLDVLTAGTGVSQGVAELGRAFPGGAIPASVVITGRGTGGEGVSGPAARQAAQDLVARAASRPELFPGEATWHLVDSRRALVVDVPLAGDGSDAASRQALRDLREELIPATVGRAGFEAAVTGETASDTDFRDLLDRRAPWVIGFVLLLAFVLLLWTFGSPVIAVTAIALTVLSVAASYGALALVFQHGALDWLGVDSYGAIVPWLPLFIFVLLFGLAMDYQVFLLSRIREERDAGLDTRSAIVAGISGSAGVVTSAAVIMVAVFSMFALLDFVPMAMFGIGMGVAVLLDATVIRGVLLPAVMAVFGERNWTPMPGLRGRARGRAHA